MADNMMRIAGRDILTGNAKALTVVTDENGDGALRVVDSAPYAYDIDKDVLKVFTTERSVAKIVMFDSLEITDITSRDVTVNLSMYKSYEIFAYSTLADAASAPVDVKLELNAIGSRGVNVYIGSEWVLTTSKQVTIPSTSDGKWYQLTSHPEFAYLRNVISECTVSDILKFRVRIPTAPTSGILRMVLYGLPN